MSNWPGGDTYKREEAERLPDHVNGAIEALRRVIRKLETGTSPEDIGPDVVLIGRLMARKI